MLCASAREAFGLDVVIGIAGHAAAVLNKDQVRQSDRLTRELQVRVQALVCLAINLPACNRQMAAPAQRLQRTAGMRIQIDRARHRQTFPGNRKQVSHARVSDVRVRVQQRTVVVEQLAAPPVRSMELPGGMDLRLRLCQRQIGHGDHGRTVLRIQFQIVPLHRLPRARRHRRRMGRLGTDRCRRMRRRMCRSRCVNDGREVLCAHVSLRIGIQQRSGHRSVKTRLSMQLHRKRRRASLAMRLHPEHDQRAIKFVQIAGREIDVQLTRLRHGDERRLPVHIHI